MPGTPPTMNSEAEARLAAVAHREKDAGEFFPWDVIEGGIRKGALRARYEQYLRG